MRKINYLLGIVFLFGAISLQSCSDEPSCVEPSTRSSVDFSVTYNYNQSSDTMGMLWLMEYNWQVEDFDAFQVCFRPFEAIQHASSIEVLGTVYRNSIYFFNVANPDFGFYSVRAIKFPSYPGAEPTILASSDEYMFFRRYLEVL